MKRNKKLLTVLALNSLAVAAGSAQSGVNQVKYDQLYNKMIKNAETGKSNKSNYELLENILNKKNKELKDLYLQGDYVVKPEYLEWQVFFSGFYSEKERGDNTLDNAKYYAFPETAGSLNTISGEIYNSILQSGVSNDMLQSILRGNKADYEKLSTNQKELVDKLFQGMTYSTLGKFKPYRNDNDIKVVDLGISINMKGVDRGITDLLITDVAVTDLESGTLEFTMPDALDIPNLNITSFNPTIPNITTINFNSIPVLSLNGTGGGNGGITGFYPYGDDSGPNSIISQMDITSGTINVRTNTSTQNGASTTNPGYYDYTLDNLTGAPSAGLRYDQRGTYDSGTGTWTYEDAVLPTGIYTNSINNNPNGYINQVQGLFKVIDNPITRYGTAGGNVNDLKVTLEGDVVNAEYLVQILHYDEHYSGMQDPVTGEWKNYTLDELEERNWITAAEKTELGNKFLDTTLGQTTDNRDFQYVENNSSWNLKGSNVVAVNIQAHGGWQDANSIFMNRGEIIGLNEASSTNNLIGKHVAFMFTEGSSQRKQEGFDNTGLIEMRAPESVLFLMTNNASSYSYSESNDSYGNNNISDNPGKHILMNNGDMKLYGNNNIGVYTHNAPMVHKNEYAYYYSNGTWNESKSIYQGLQRTEMRLYNPITVLGDQSIGVDIERELNFANSKIKVDIGTEDPRQTAVSSSGVNGLENSGNIAGGNSAYTDSAAGIYVNMGSNIMYYSKYVYDQNNTGNNVNISGYKAENPQFTLSDYLLNIGEHSRGGVGLRVEDYGDVILGSSSDTTTNHEINLLAGSEGNAGIYLRGSNITTITFEPDPVWNPGYTETVDLLGFLGTRVTTDGLVMNIDGNKQVGVQIEDYGYFYHKNGNIKVNGTNNTGIAVKTGGTGELSDTGIINVSAGNLGVYNDSQFTMDGGTINVGGLASVGVYSEAGNTDTILKGGTIKSTNGGIGLYAGTGSVMNLNQGVNLTAGNKGLLFYNYDGSALTGKYNVTGTVGATVENGGNAFYIKSGTTLTNYLNNSFIGTGNLDLTLKSGSKLYILDGEGGTFNLTALDSVTNAGGAIGNNVTINAASAADYIPVSMNKGTLVLDRDINMDNSGELYKRSEFSSASVSLESGKTITGTQNNQTGIAQRNYAGSSGVDAVKITNKGTVDLSGSGAIGLAADYGHIINNNKVRTTGDKSVGVYSANGTVTENNGDIITGGNSSAGIYGVNYLDGVTDSSVLGYGNNKIDITNNGKIASEGTGKVYGVYAANNAVPTADSKINLANGTIDISSSKGGTGIYAANTTVTGGGTLTIGSDSLGMYAKDSNVNLSGMTLNIKGNNSLGFYLDGTTAFNGNGNINIDGQNIALFNVTSNGIFNNNFTVSSAAGSTYTVGKISNTTFIYDGTSSLSENGSLIMGNNSAVLLDSNSNVSATGNNVVAVSLDGQYTGILPAGFMTDTDGENRGNITLGDNSAGLYGKNGTRLLNSGNITAGNSSLGMKTDGTGSSLANSGTITVGSNSVGMYGKETDKVINMISGVINGSSPETVGMYLNTSNAGTVTNVGLIDLSGDKARGIYAEGTGAKSISNIGTIKIGDSSNSANPGIGIYSKTAGDIITNTGTIAAGVNSIGVYSLGGTVNQDSVITTGGIGVYADSSAVNLNTGSDLITGDNGAVGVYAINGSNVVNSGTTTVGNGSYGYVLKSGSNLMNNSLAAVGDNGVFAYGDGAGILNNSSDVILTGSDSFGFYTVNGGAITNSGNITGDTGVSNIAIYNKDGSIYNTGNITVGDSVILDTMNTENNRYAVGIYGKNSQIYNSGDIKVGYYGVGIFGSESNIENHGNIISDAEGAIGLFIENGTLDNYGNVTLSGNSSMGIYANKGATVTNYGIVTVNGESSQGVYLNLASTLDNQGTININGNNSQGVLLKGEGKLVNSGTINLASGLVNSETVSYGSASSYPVPSIINAGVINVSENFETNGLDISIKANPDSMRTAEIMEDMGAAFVSDAVKFYAPSFSTTDPINVMSGFAAGTHAETYKLKDVFNPMTEEGGPNSGLVKVKSKSLTWSATPVINSRGNVDIWMQKIPYDEFTSGLWFEDFGLALDTKYAGSAGNAGLIFDKIDTIETEYDFRRTMSNLAGDIYANMNQREETIADVFESSLNLLQNSKNNTKENVKINVLAGKGSVKEDTEGVVGYDYETVGALALREVERTYKHTFGYSAGYSHTNFEFKDGNNSEEDVDTVQLGLHSKYKSNDWILRNDLTGRMNLHNVDRNLDWTNAGSSNMSGNYETYSITSDNKLGKEISLGKRASVTPYGGLKAMYTTRPTFSENGLEALEVEGNDAWSVKPRVGVELKGEMPLGSSESWKLKGAVDLAYEYELGDLNEREYAKLVNVETDYHKLAKPEKDKGQIRTGASLGVEVEDRYGIFVTGDYRAGNDKQDDYRVGVTLKAVF
ncbi:autotransporter domain-containing protein [Sebaldella termitidis]|uniref:autotransporter domain-containing protein n=1 Tax=Sebaldella termitidis TaxID=826 RepID=UPI003EBD5BD4